MTTFTCSKCGRQFGIDTELISHKYKQCEMPNASTTFTLPSEVLETLKLAKRNA